MTLRILSLAIYFLMIAGCTGVPPTTVHETAGPAPGQAAPVVQDDPPPSNVEPGPGRPAADGAYEALLPIDWDDRFGPEVMTPGGAMVGFGWSAGMDIDTNGSLALSGDLILTWLATGPTDRELYVRMSQVGCTPDPCTAPSVASQGPSPLRLIFAFGNGSESLHVEVGSARLGGMQVSTFQEFHLDGIVRRARSGSPPPGTMVARVQESWAGHEEVTTTGPDCSQAIHGGFSHFDGVAWTIPGTWEGLPVRASRLAIQIEHGPTTPLGCYRLFSPEGTLLWQGSEGDALTGDFAPGNYTVSAALTGVGASVNLSAAADLVLA